MLNYRDTLKPLAKQLRGNMTDAEQKLWFHLRRKQILGVAFFRQRPIGEYIVDFYAPTKKLVIEVDGSQHFDADIYAKDAARTAYLESLGFHVLRFNNQQVLTETASVLEMIHRFIDDRKSLPPCRPRGPLHRPTVSQASGMPLEFPASPSLLQREESRS